MAVIINSFYLLLSTSSVCCASIDIMDDFRFIKLVFLFYTHVLVSNQMVPDDVTTTMTSPADVIDRFECPLIDITHASLKGITHNITRSIPCKNGRNMDGCCVERFYCDFNTSHIDLTLYGPPGFRIPCQLKEICCPQKYILPIPLSNTTKNEKNDNTNFKDNHVFSDNSNDD